MISTRILAALAGAAMLAGAGAALAADMSTAMHGRFGGPVYSGAPNLPVTVALVVAGGGPGKFSTATALTSMVGSDLVTAEVTKLTKQYGKTNVDLWLQTFDFAVNDAVKVATAEGVKLPAPADLQGKALATTLVQAGTDSTGTFQIEYLLDKAVSHSIHNKVMDDIDASSIGGNGKFADYNYHRISNQAFYDLARALGATSVKLAYFH